MSDAWCVLHTRDLMSLLRRARNGESPDLLYAEIYANAEHQHHPDATIDDIIVDP